MLFFASIYCYVDTQIEEKWAEKNYHMKQEGSES
jgi:hypothetical protein